MTRQTLNPQHVTAPWHITTYGMAQVNTIDNAMHLGLPQVDASRYHDAQLSDYQTKADFRWKPPLRLTVTASMSSTNANPESPLCHEMAIGEVSLRTYRCRELGGEDLNEKNVNFVEGEVGTAGFGFWNHPFVPGERGLRLPKAVWFFFSSPPNNMRLARDVPGPGWKAATIDATRWPFLALAPAAPIGVLLMRIPALYRRLWPVGQRAIGVSEHLLDASLLLKTHTYTIDWQPDHIRFAVDGVTVHQAPLRITGPLGFIAWIDNQYAIVTPQGNLGFGLVPVPHPLTLILNHVEIESLSNG